MSTRRRDPTSFCGLPLGSRRPWTLVVAEHEYDITRLAPETERREPAQELMCDAAGPLLELALRVRFVEEQIDVIGDTLAGLLADELRGVRDVSAGAGSSLRRALDAHGRDLGYSTRSWHERGAELTGTILRREAGTCPAEIAVTASLQLTLALHAARRDQMAVPRHLAAATGRVDAVRALASALLPEPRRR